MDPQLTQKRANSVRVPGVVSVLTFLMVNCESSLAATPLYPWVTSFKHLILFFLFYFGIIKFQNDENIKIPFKRTFT